MTDPMCECPKCGRLHRDLQAGKPPMAIAGPSLLREAITLTAQPIDRKAPSKEGERSELSSSREPTGEGVADDLTDEQLTDAKIVKSIERIERFRFKSKYERRALKAFRELQCRRSTPAGRGEGGWRA